MCAKKQAVPPLTVGAELVWYTWTASLQRRSKYMIDLLKSQELFQAGTLQLQHRGQPAKHYDEVLKGADGEVRARQAARAPALADAPAAGLALDVDAPAVAVSDGLEAEIAELPAVLPRRGLEDVPRSARIAPT